MEKLLSFLICIYVKTIEFEGLVAKLRPRQGETKMNKHGCPPGKLLLEVTSPKLNCYNFRKSADMYAEKVMMLFMYATKMGCKTLSRYNNLAS